MSENDAPVPDRHKNRGREEPGQQPGQRPSYQRSNLMPECHMAVQRALQVGQVDERMAFLHLRWWERWKSGELRGLFLVRNLQGLILSGENEASRVHVPTVANSFPTNELDYSFLLRWHSRLSWGSIDSTKEIIIILP
jgi:hypothetical protein